jgi:hypothetical protein
MVLQRTLSACVVLFLAVAPNKADAWTRADFAECVIPLSQKPCPIPAKVLTMTRHCDDLPLDLMRQGIDPHDAMIACEDFVLVNSRLPANMDELRAQIAAEKRGLEATNAVQRNSELANSAIQQVRARLLESLRDPDSAKFRDEHVIQWNGKIYVCGEMNAKNAYGGYVGYQPYMINPTATGIEIGVALAMGANSGRTSQCLSPNSQSQHSPK